MVKCFCWTTNLFQPLTGPADYTPFIPELIN